VVTPFGIIFTVVGANPLSTADAIPAANATFTPEGVAVSSTGVIFFSDHDSSRVRFVTNGTIYTLAGNGQQGLSGDGGPSAQAALNHPTGVALDPSGGGLYIGDSSNFRVRMVDDNFVITTVAGNGAFRNSGDGGPATSAPIYFPSSIAVDNSRNLYIAEGALARKKVAPNGVITTFAGTGVTGYNGDGKPATASSFALPTGVATDSAGAVYIADFQNNRVRKVALDGTVSTVAGTGAFVDSGDGGPAIGAGLDSPLSVVVDRAGNLYIAGNQRVRKVTPDGIIHAFAGTGQAGYNGDNTRLLAPA
jgi:sugar lactone lactonase YvrE